MRYVCVVVAALGVAAGCRTAPAVAPTQVEDAPSVSAARGLQLACDEGNLDACDQLAMRYLDGNGVALDPAAAVPLFEENCAKGHAASCYRLGLLTSSGTGTEQDVERAKVAYRAACDGGHTQACNDLAVLMARDGADPAATIQMYREACAQKNALACFNLAFQLEQREELAEAAVAYEAACELGNREGCNALAIAYRYGRGVEADAARAAKIYEETCLQREFALSCNNVGTMFFAGSGVARDLSAAAMFYQRGCALGFARACTNYGNVLAEVGSQDPVAAQLYRLGCERGDGRGCSNLGVAYVQGTGGVEKSPKDAVRMFEAGCRASDASACSNVGLMYEQGIGVERDYTAASAFYEAACKAQELQACHNLALMLWEGRGAEPARGRAADYLIQACDGGHVASCSYLGRQWVQTEGKEDLGRELMRRACAGGDAAACK